MNKSAALKLLEVYEERILDCPQDVGLTKENAVERMNEVPFNSFDTLSHAYTMILRMKLMVHNDTEKFCRWLGFMQGILWTEMIYTVEQLKDHNRAVFAGKPGVVFNDTSSPHRSEDEKGYE